MTKQQTIESVARNLTSLEQLISGWTPEQVEEGRKTAQEWDARDRQRRAWSAPVAARYGQDWEFFVKADLVEFGQEPDEVRYLRPLLRA